MAIWAVCNRKADKAKRVIEEDGHSVQFIWIISRDYEHKKVKRE